MSTEEKATVSRDKTGRSKWSHELVENSNAIDGFFRNANTLVILVVAFALNVTKITT